MSALLVLLAVLAWIVLAVVGLALVVLAFPLHLRAWGAVREGEPSGAVDARWAFGFVAVEASPSGLSVRVAGATVWRTGWRDLRRGEAAKAKKKARVERKPEEEEPGRKGGNKLRAVLDHRRPLLRMLARFVRALHLRLRATGLVGLHDPADTAVLAGVLAQLGEVPGVELDVELDWLDETLEGEAVGSARVWVPELLAAAAALLIERTNRAVVRALTS